MEKSLILVLLCIGLTTSDLLPYKPRGWRPNGRPFNPTNNRLQTYYGPPGLPAYEPPDNTEPPPIFTTSTTPRATTAKATTTPRSREPTTSTSAPDEDFDDAGALAIANSFAFNRPIYIYNNFPFLPGHVLV